jgi:hypothetical protein
MSFHVPLDSRSLKLAKTVKPHVLSDHVLSRGWQLTDKKTKFSDVYRSRPTKKKREIRIAIPRTTRPIDYAYSVAFVAAVIADHEDRDVDDVLDQFVAASADKKPRTRKKTAAG